MLQSASYRHHVEQGNLFSQPLMDADLGSPLGFHSTAQMSFATVANVSAFADGFCMEVSSRLSESLVIR